MGPQEIISALSLTDGDHHPQWIEDILGPQIIKSLTISKDVRYLNEGILGPEKTRTDSSMSCKEEINRPVRQIEDIFHPHMTRSISIVNLSSTFAKLIWGLQMMIRSPSIMFL